MSKSGSIGLLVAMLAGFVRPAAAQETIADNKSFEVGVWVQDLYNLSVADGSFSADLWIWSRGINPKREPLKTMQFVNMTSARENGLYQQQQKGNIYWAQRLVQGKFRYDWDVSNYPFDRHSLQIVIDEGLDDTTAFKYLVDSRGSDYSSKIKLGGWRITGFKVEGRPAQYNTTFGNPELAYDNRSLYPEIVVTLDIQRDEIMSFLKLLSILLIAFGLSLLTYLLPGEAMDARLGLVVGAIFAGAFNMREASAVLGADQGLTLVDQIHVTALVIVLGATIAAVKSRRMVQEGRPEKEVRRFNYYCLAASLVSFAIATTVLIAVAIQQG
jgi:hypothetical protein